MAKPDAGKNGPREHDVHLDDIARAIDQHKANYLAAMRRTAEHPEQRPVAINQALESAIGMSLAMRMGDLFVERVHGKDGMSPEPSAEGEATARKWAMETMATITVRLLFLMFGPEFYPTRALHADIRRWLTGSDALTYRPIGRRNPASPDAVRLSDRTVAVLAIKMSAAASGVHEKSFIERLPTPRPSYDQVRDWQTPVAAQLRTWSVNVGKRAHQKDGGEVLLPGHELNRLSRVQLAVLGVVMNEGLHSLLASVMEAGAFKGTGAGGKKPKPGDKKS